MSNDSERRAIVVRIPASLVERMQKLGLAANASSVVEEALARFFDDRSERMPGLRGGGGGARR